VGTSLGDGGGSDELLYRFDRGDGPNPNLTDWTRDGRFLVYSHDSDVWALPLTDGPPESRTPVRVVGTEGNQQAAYVSPDLRWIAYISNESGRQDMFVQPFAPAPAAASGAAATGKWMVSNGTIGMARWRADSRELLFLAADGGVMSVNVTPGAVFTADPPRLLFALPRSILTMGLPGGIIDVTRDHQRFLVSMPTAAVGSGYKVAINWATSAASAQSP